MTQACRFLADQLTLFGPGLDFARHLTTGPLWLFSVHQQRLTQCSSQVRPSHARTKLETATKQTLSLGSGSILSKWPTSLLPPNISSAATLSWVLFTLAWPWVGHILFVLQIYFKWQHLVWIFYFITAIYNIVSRWDINHLNCLSLCSHVNRINENNV